ncbi:SpoIIE family protein phosphatase [Streptomyces humi]|uniref:SpoIIE family protein phosphatase n=1 Tax=Streptomyces humi TaxID=1428620 RepID=UPI001F0A7F63|nr:SpoIIE family protein phosphatase [Streptomyces humi]
MSLERGRVLPEGLMDDRSAPDAVAPGAYGRVQASAGEPGGELTAVLYRAVHQTAHRLHAVAAAVYLLTPDGGELRAAMIGGSPPSVLTLPGRMTLDSPYASARALAFGGPALLADPDPLADPRHDALAYPYTVASVPLEREDRRFGSLTVLRTENGDGYDEADRRRLTRIAERLVALLCGLQDRGVAVVPGTLPVLVPVLGTEPHAVPAAQAVRGVPGVPGSSGMTLLYALQRLTEMLNRATTWEHVVGAAEFCLMAPLGARALALASAAEGRLWVLGHSGDSAALVRELHGTALHSGAPAARALRERALFDSGAPAPFDSGAPAPFGGAPAPFGGAPASFGGAPAPFGGAPAPFGGAPASFGGAPAPFGGAPDPSGPGASVLPDPGSSGSLGSLGSSGSSGAPGPADADAGPRDAPARDAGPGGDAAPAAAYLPLVGSRHVEDLPMAEAAPVVGVCCLSFDGPRVFPPEERAVLTMMAGRLGSAVQRIELSTGRRALVEGMQRRLLPAALADTPRLTTTARYRPAPTAGETGGDWYDVITMPDDRVVLVLGDVEGHTLESAAVMGQLRTAVAAYATEGHGPAAVLERTGRLLPRLGTELLATCCVMAVDTGTGAAEVALAGHPAPLARLPDGTVRRLSAPANVPLGVRVREPYGAREHTLPPGSVLVLYSDGLHVRDRDDVRERLDAVGAPADTGLEHLADRLLQDAPASRDDAALLLARYEGTDSGRSPRVAGMHLHRRDLRAVREARGFVRERLDDWGLADLSDDLTLITSELVTNALVHAGSDVDVRLRVTGDRLRLEVRDADTDPPVPAAYSLTEEGSARAEHGRGLYLVDALAHTWNTSPSGRGKTVWLEMDIPGADGGGA